MSSRYFNQLCTIFLVFVFFFPFFLLKFCDQYEIGYLERLVALFSNRSTQIKCFSLLSFKVFYLFSTTFPEMFGCWNF